MTEHFVFSRVYTAILDVVQSENHPSALLKAIKLLIKIQNKGSVLAKKGNLWPRVQTLLSAQGPLRVGAVQLLASLVVEVADSLYHRQPVVGDIWAEWWEIIDVCSSADSVCFFCTLFPSLMYSIGIRVARSHSR